MPIDFDDDKLDDEIEDEDGLEDEGNGFVCAMDGPRSCKESGTDECEFECPNGPYRNPEGWK